MKLPAATSDFKPLEPGTHLAICYEVIDFGTQRDVYEGEENIRRKLWIGWEIPDQTMDDGRPFVIGKEYTLSMHEKSALRKHLEAWRGIPFTDDDLGESGKFDVKNIIGKPCALSVTHNDKGRAKVASVIALMKGTEVPAKTNDERFLSLAPDEFDVEAYHSLNEWMKEKIALSPEFSQTQKPVAGPITVPEIDETDDNDLPF